MPLTKPLATKGLAIYVDNPQATYRPGDTITGHVARQVPVLVGADDVTVEIHLVGTALAKLSEWTDHTGESSSSYTSVFPLLDPAATRLQLHAGPLHIPRTVDGLSIDTLKTPEDRDRTIGRSWPFSLAVPRQTAAGNVPKSRAYIGGLVPVDKDGHVASHPLPSSTYLDRTESGPGSFRSGFIEYYLDACLNNSNLATLPIKIVA
ncbi:Spc97 / Spc98 family protein [Purpureocillium lavendulum]|uniref:Spc97 / Spc98 family protein n=1 Tax=Purpureocillium lavendulum TaxID=1247861 RepID=A0AB34G0K3_9HYPO|nr:Spc97 / Spc98 family protein [Purpureocillium lavendulum]